jgi:hypothetical protein
MHADLVKEGVAKPRASTHSNAIFSFYEYGAKLLEPFF